MPCSRRLRSSCLVDRHPVSNVDSENVRATLAAGCPHLARAHDLRHYAGEDHPHIKQIRAPEGAHYAAGGLWRARVTLPGGWVTGWLTGFAAADRDPDATEGVARHCGSPCATVRYFFICDGAVRSPGTSSITMWLSGAPAVTSKAACVTRSRRLGWGEVALGAFERSTTRNPMRTSAAP